MKNRFSDDLLAFSPPVSETPTTPADVLHAARKQLDQQRQWIETYVQEHPVVGIGTALCIGVLIGWISKRR
jgi:ElaB/YqjD/DUF883 family membrane-anchored ribosome-binding protein